MFCQKCGAPTEGEQTLCSKCATEESVVSKQEVSVQSENASGTQNPQFTLYSEKTPVEKPVKKKGGLIAGIVTLSVVAAIAAAAVFFWDSIVGFYGRTFQSPEDYFVSVESAAIADYSEDLVEYYGEFLDTYSANKTAGKVQLQLSLGDEILSLANSFMSQQGIAMDIDWLSNISLSLDTNVQKDALRCLLGVGLNNKDLLSADVICSWKDSKIYMAIPELNKEYMYTDLPYQVDTDSIRDAISEYTKANEAFVNALPSEKEIQKLINTYTDIVLSEITNVNKSTETVSVDDASQKMVVLSAKIKQKDLLNIAQKVLEEAEKDKTIEKLFTAFSNYMNATNSAMITEVDLYQEFIKAIPDALESIQQAKENVDGNNYLKLQVYVDMQNTVRGYAFSFYTDGQISGEKVSCMTVEKGNTVYVEAKTGPILIEGEKTEKKGVSEGFYTLIVDGEKMGTLKFEDVTEDTGSIRLIPSEEIINAVLSGSGIPGSLLGGNISLELVRSDDSYEVNVLVGSKTLIGLALSGEAYDGGKISIPSNTTELNDYESMQRWLEKADFNTVLDNLKKAEVPEELISVIESYIEAIG